MSSTPPQQGGGTGGTAQEGAGPPAPSGRQQGRNGNQGRNGRSSGRGNHQGGRNGNQQGTCFTGATSDLETCTFGIHDGYASVKKYSDNIKKLKIYAFKNFTTDLGNLFGKSPIMPTAKKPELAEKDKEDQTAVEMYKLELKEYMDVKRKMGVEIKRMYAIVLGQCTEGGDVE